MQGHKKPPTRRGVGGYTDAISSEVILGLAATILKRVRNKPKISPKGIQKAGG